MASKPPPSGQMRRPAGLTPPPTSRLPQGRGHAGEANADTVPPPPPVVGGGKSPTGRTPPRPAGRLRTQGMPIKTKIVVWMCGLVIVVSLTLSIIAMIATTATLDDTIEQSGLGMVQQAEYLYRQYRAGLNEGGLIAYFNQPKNRQKKFSATWQQLRTNKWWHAQIPPCEEFATWDQFVEDRAWVMVAGEFLDAQKLPNPPRAELRDQVLGDQGQAIASLPAGAELPRPPVPRRLASGAISALDKNKSVLEKLFRSKGMDPQSASTSDLLAAINKDTREQLVGNLRKTILYEYRMEFTQALRDLTASDGSQIRLAAFKIKGSQLVGIGDPEKELSVSSSSSDKPINVDPGLNSRREGDVEIYPKALAGGIEAYGFRKVIADQDGDEVQLYLDRHEIESRKRGLLFSIMGVSAMAIFLAIFLSFVIGGSITKPLNTLMTDIQIISGGNFSHQPLARSRDEIGIVSRLLGDMALGLKAAQDVWTENQSRKHDLDIAKEIQENLLPKHVPRIAGYDVSAYYSPSKEVGGDYYDFFLVDKTHLGMICADVSGKGIPGSMVMMMCKALISYEASENLSPRDIFCKVNRTLAKDIKRGMFVTAFYMLLDIPTARLTVASAGHNPLLLYRAATRQCTQINPGGIALGFDKDGRLFERNMKEEVIQLQRGDRAVIFTDGVTEAMSPTNEEFGEERLMAITVQCAGKTSSEYLTQMVNAIQSHAQSDEQHDDITVVTLKVG